MVVLLAMLATIPIHVVVPPPQVTFLEGGRQLIKDSGSSVVMLDRRVSVVAASTASTATTTIASTTTTTIASTTTIVPQPWSCIEFYESTYRNISNGLGDYGYFQISESSWLEVGMSGNPMDWPLSVQLAGAEKVQRVQGWGAWETHLLCGV